MSDTHINLIDVSLRDGLQSERTIIPTKTKVAIAELLICAGVRHLQVTSFVSPQRVPQMADAEELLRQLPQSDGVRYSALILNQKGLTRCLRTRLTSIDLSLSCSNTHSMRNTGMSLAQAEADVLAMIELAKASRMRVRVGLQCAFGCNFEGPVRVEVVERLAGEMIQAGCDELALADSTGRAIPADIKNLVNVLRPLVDVPLILHLHDTRGLAMANVLAAYEVGVRAFDVAMGGIGGCPFIADAGGNVAIEDAVHLFERMGLSTGIEAHALYRATESLEAALDYPLPGRVFQWSKKQLARTSSPQPQSQTVGGGAWA